MNDPSDENEKQASQVPSWQGSAAAMDRWYAVQMRGAGAVATQLMLKKAELGLGKRVLEVAAGTGNETMQMADIVGADGYILATDVSEEMIGTANRKIKEAGYRNVDLKVMDAAKLEMAPASFDIAVCRMGLMLFPDPKGALQCMWTALRKGGHIAAMVMSVPEQNPLIAIPTTIIREHLELGDPEPSKQQIFSLAPDGVLKSMLEETGFMDVEVESVAGDLKMTLSEIRSFVTERSGAIRALLAQTDDSTKEELLRLIGTSMEQFKNGETYTMPQEFLVATGRKPA